MQLKNNVNIILESIFSNSNKPLNVVTFKN